MNNSPQPFVFTKMHVNGNDFVLVNAMLRDPSFDPDTVRFLGDRRRGIGFDQLLLIGKPEDSSNNASVQFYNRDGSTAEQCGNGCAAVTAFLHRHQLASKPMVQLETPAQVTECELINAQGQELYTIDVCLGAPSFIPQEIPFLAETQQRQYELTLPNCETPISVSVLSIGNPHAVIVVPSVDEVEIENLGSKVQQHEAFPDSCNVGFLEILDGNNGRLRVFERGVGETHACGTGAAAAMVAGRLLDSFVSEVNMSTARGQTTVKWEGTGNPVLVQCTPIFVFTGTWVHTKLQKNIAI